MKKSFTLLLVALFGCLAKSHACDCATLPSFCESITFENNGQIQDGLHIYLGTVSAKTGIGVNLLVEKTYFGDMNTGQNLSLISGNGANCIVMLDNFQVGEQYLIAARQSSENTWYLLDCGVYYLRVQNGMVSGAIAPGVSTVSLADFPNMANCGNLVAGNELDFLLRVAPTLAATADGVSITTRLPAPAPIQIAVFDAAGRLVHQAKEPAFDENKPIVLDTQTWASGMYFVRMDLLGQRKAVKIVKVER
ncbi:MAG: T9SS type A sorting domain-containing protein [Saprospiraceae bacterium]|nr:T9SS type A sorting domain-containing protein [Saprospiraceae bacterium]